MTDSYTRADWRPSKKRAHEPRRKPWGGRKPGHAPPQWLAVMAEWAAKPYDQRAPLCVSLKRDGSPCRRYALRGCKVCGSHGGYAQRARRGEHVPTGKGPAIRAERARRAQEMTGAPGAPIELTRLPVYVEASPSDRARLIGAWGTAAWSAVVKDVRG